MAHSAGHARGGRGGEGSASHSLRRRSPRSVSQRRLEVEETGLSDGGPKPGQGPHHRSVRSNEHKGTPTRCGRTTGVSVSVLVLTRGPSSPRTEPVRSALPRSPSSQTGPWRARSRQDKQARRGFPRCGPHGASVFDKSRSLIPPWDGMRMGRKNVEM
ncbi:hypothetical protein AcW2_003957 [Taiwanofungus camphoratus]|nr:hypothetical protein AcW2_003957 [Antrodia cinnamomea]